MKQITPFFQVYKDSEVRRYKLLEGKAQLKSRKSSEVR
jgi:hypothetical protein